MPFRALFCLAVLAASLLPLSVFAQSISGSIRDEGGQPISAAVRIYRPSEEWVENFGIDPVGNFSTPPLEDGTYSAVTAYAHDRMDEAWNDIPCENLICDVTATTPIEVASGDVVGIFRPGRW